MTDRIPAWAMGTVFLWDTATDYLTNGILSLSDAEAVSSEEPASLSLGFVRPMMAGVVFPFKVDITKVFLSAYIRHGAVGANYGNYGNIEVSADATAPTNGVWTVSEAHPNEDAAAGNWGSPITLATPANGVTGIRINFTTANDGGNRVDLIHVYGTITDGQDIKLVQFWDPVADQALDPESFALGDVYMGGSAEVSFRLKNLSSVSSASDVVLSTTVAIDGVPSIVPDHGFSVGGAEPTETLNVGTLAPDEISGVVTLTVSKGYSAAEGAFYPAIVVTPTEWS